MSCLCSWILLCHDWIEVTDSECEAMKLRVAISTCSHGDMRWIFFFVFLFVCMPG